jgi:putative transposase
VEIALVEAHQLCNGIVHAQSFFNLLERERIRRRTYWTRQEAGRACSAT